MIGLGERIKRAAEQVGGLDHLAPMLTDVSRRTLSDWANDKTEPRASALVEIAKATDVSLIWLLNGGQATFPPRPEDGMRGSQIQSMGGVTDLNQPDMIRLPVYSEVHASAGAGAMPASELADGVMALDRRFLRDQGAVPEQCVVIWARGDSMMPTIPDGSALVVDRSQFEIADGCIMVLNVGGSLLVKRVQRLISGEVRLLSDNRDYEPEILSPNMLDQVRVVGRVVYFGRTP